MPERINDIKDHLKKSKEPSGSKVLSHEREAKGDDKAGYGSGCYWWK